ncbi:hypothetical protein ACFO5R_01645 [Halosolutus amylolyticus]|uniref:Uncharacterized protein n=1 Tax=Halosolutus amylolyticus TaxID=2932267 RepID=A0ABD5PJM7_9EURY|nr:hypothetical protein [Halosolutus amylolyticus]
MTAPERDQRDRTSTETIELPATAATQRALHEAIGHLYDELAATGNVDAVEAGHVPDEVFEGIEDLYVGSAEESIASVEIRYELIE